MTDVESMSQSSVAVDMRIVTGAFLGRFGEPDWDWRSKSSSQLSDGTAGQSARPRGRKKDALRYLNRSVSQ
jgi:hypothetical protein